MDNTPEEIAIYINQVGLPVRALNIINFRLQYLAARRDEVMDLLLALQAEGAGDLFTDSTTNAAEECLQNLNHIDGMTSKLLTHNYNSSKEELS